jgi:hypothetical protein
LRAGVCVSDFATIGIEIGIVADRASVCSNDARAPQKILGVKLSGRARGKERDSFTSKENIFICCGTGSVCLREYFAARAVPVELAVGFGDAAAIAVIAVADTGGGLKLAFAVPCIGVNGISYCVATRVVAEARKMII